MRALLLLHGVIGIVADVTPTSIELKDALEGRRSRLLVEKRKKLQFLIFFRDKIFHRVVKTDHVLPMDFPLPLRALPPKLLLI